jgi:hypothetical protein
LASRQVGFRLRGEVVDTAITPGAAPAVAGMVGGSAGADVGDLAGSMPCRYLRGIDKAEIVHTVHERPAPMIPATNGLLSMR